MPADLLGTKYTKLTRAREIPLHKKKKSKKCHILLHMYFYRNRVLICNLKIIGQTISWHSYVADKNTHVCLVMFAYTKDSGYRETPLPLHPFSSLSYVFFILETGKYKRIMGSIWKYFYFKIFLNSCNNQFLLRISYLLVSQAYHLREHLHSNNMKKYWLQIRGQFQPLFQGLVT